MVSQLQLIANGRIWIDTTEGPLLGYGRIELLEKVKQTGSIRQAALSMKMSYRQAYYLIDQMNTRAGKPLVNSQRGGKGGGQAILTDAGEEAIRIFKEFNKEFQDFLQERTLKLVL